MAHLYSKEAGEWRYVEDYEKCFYDVKTPEGEIIRECWPNAGKFNDVHGKGERRSWEAGTVLVRESTTHPVD